MGENTVKLRRSMLFVPGANAAMISNSFIYKPDAIMFDLEDSVSLKEKDGARMLVVQALKHPFYKDIERIVRVNALTSNFGKEDIRATVKAKVDVIRLPKTDSAQDVIDMEHEIELAEKEFGIKVGTTKMLAAIESALGILNSKEIAFSSNRLIGIALGAEDYVRDIKTERSPDGIELLFARNSILHAARAAGIMAFDTVYSDSNNDEGFLKEATLIKQLGFDGKSLVNPKQIEMIHNLYAPTQKDVDYAKQVLSTANDALKKGLGVASINGKMIDAPIIERAKLVLEKVELSGIREN